MFSQCYCYMFFLKIIKIGISFEFHLIKIENILDMIKQRRYPIIISEGKKL